MVKVKVASIIFFIKCVNWMAGTVRDPRDAKCPRLFFLELWTPDRRLIAHTHTQVNTHITIKSDRDKDRKRERLRGEDNVYKEKEGR